jgi:hypothetical protein
VSEIRLAIYSFHLEVFIEKLQATSLQTDNDDTNFLMNRQINKLEEAATIMAKNFVVDVAFCVSTEYDEVTQW